MEKKVSHKSIPVPVKQTASFHDLCRIATPHLPEISRMRDESTSRTCISVKELRDLEHSILSCYKKCKEIEDKVDSVNQKVDMLLRHRGVNIPDRVVFE